MNIENPKYIILAGKFDLPAPVLFASHIQHDVMAGNQRVLSAGFYNPAKREAYGESVSLGIRSKDGDGELIEQFLNPRVGAAV